MKIKQGDVSEEYAKNKELREEDVKVIQDWILKQPHLPYITELQVILFLHSCYYSIEQAKHTIDTYFTVRTHCPEFFADRDPNSASVQRFTNIVLFATLPKLTPEGNCVKFMRLTERDPNKYVFNEQLKSFDMTSMMELNENGTTNGVLIVYDMEGVAFSHITKVGLMSLKKFMYYLQNAMPIRLKGIHFINIVPFMDKFLALIKPFMKKELIDIMHIHLSLESLYQYVPQECLPSDYGGSADSFVQLHDKMKQKLAASAQYFEDETKQFVDETKRPGKPKGIEDLFGVEGSFKTLNID